MSRDFKVPMPLGAFYTYPDGMLVSLAGSEDPPKEIFYILSNIRRNITSMEHFRALGLNMSQVVRLEAEELQMIRLGFPMCSQFPCPGAGVSSKSHSFLLHTHSAPFFVSGICSFFENFVSSILICHIGKLSSRMGWSAPSQPRQLVATLSIMFLSILFLLLSFLFARRPTLRSIVKPLVHLAIYC